MTRVSIVVPCYNVEDKIERCIDSIMKQSYGDYICYLIDDGSTDSTANCIKNKIAEDSRFIYLYKPNGGQASARNLGIAQCDTEYITFIDSDDYVHQDYLKELEHPFLDSSVDITACYFDRVYPDRTSRNEYDEQDLRLSKFPAVWGKMFRTSVIKDNGVFFPEGLWYEDLCFFARLMVYVQNVHIVKKMLYYYIQNENSTMYTYSDKIYDIYKVFDILEKEPEMDKSINEYLQIYHILVGTVFRASFKEDFSSQKIKDILAYVERRYSKWYKNKYIQSQLPIFYRTYLWFLKHHWTGIISFILKKANCYVSL